MVPHRPSGLVRHLEPWCFEQLIASLDASSPRGLRDRAIIWCIARLGLRAGEVAQLQLDDIDWCNAVVETRPQDRHGRAAAIARRRGRRSGRLPAACPPEHRRPAGVRVISATRGRADQQRHRRPRRGGSGAGAASLRAPTWTRQGIGGRSGWRRVWTGRARPPRPTRATRLAAWGWCGGFCGTCPRSTAAPRCPRPDCSARPGTAHRRTCIPTRRSLSCCRRRPACHRPAGCGHTATPSCSG